VSVPSSYLGLQLLSFTDSEPNRILFSVSLISSRRFDMKVLIVNVEKAVLISDFDGFVKEIHEATLKVAQSVNLVMDEEGVLPC
jgi:UDP-N-acetyl-D-mannosaminuronic acid transferase (WecB/TagA/CpsF family)